MPVIEKKVNLEVEFLMIFICLKSFPGGLVVKYLPGNVGDVQWIPGR